MPNSQFGDYDKEHPVAERKSFPSIPERNWWDLRRRFLSSPPKGEVNAAYLSDVLGIQEKAAQNLIPSLRTIGLIDENGRPTARTARWRDDEHYAEVTREIISEVYPRSLLDAAPPDSADPATAQRWFLRETGTGEGRAKILSAFYRLLASGDLTRQDQRRAAERSPGDQPRGPRRTAHAARAREDAGQANGKRTDEGKAAPPVPSLNVAVQVYIDKDMSPEQVDQVFASMAKHLYGKE